MRTGLSIALAVGLIGATGCSKWKDKDTVSQAVWSDDDSQHAYTVQKWQERKIHQILETVTETRKFEYQVFIQNPDGSGRTALTPVRPGQAGPDLYFMKDQGYVIYGEVLDTPMHTIRKRNLSGGEQVVATGTAMFGPCGAMNAVPSPDGTRLAVLEHELLPGAYEPPSAPPPDALPECQDISIKVAFYDAATLAPQGAWSWESDGFMEYGWTTDDEFFVQTTAGSWRVDPVTGPQPAAAPPCLNPRTTSSNVSAAGVYVVPTEDPSDPIHMVTDSNPQTFGNCSGS